MGKRTQVGKLAAGTRVAWKRIVASSDRCAAYLEIEPRGWVCAKDLAPSDEPPAAAEQADPAKIVEHVLAELHLGVVPEGGKAYRSRTSIENGRAAKKLAGWTFLHGAVGAFSIVGTTMFMKTIEGYVAISDLMMRPASAFEGVAVTPAQWPFAWIMPVTREELTVVREGPAATAARVRDLSYRTIVPVLETRDRFARIGANEWVALSTLAVARASQRPRGVRADERWIDVDLDEKVMVTYEGDTPVFATLVSTGFGGATPTSLHRIVEKRATMTLVSPEIATGTWSIPDVPFMMIFRKYYGVHTAYWHDSFGKQRGHGCVNLSPRDARHLYDWTLPEVPAGWQEGNAVGNEGTPIRIRNRGNPDPSWTDYNSEPPVPTKDRPAR